MRAGEALETDRELNVTRADDVLDLKVGELCVEAQLLDDARVLARRQFAVRLALCTSDNHLARSEDQRRRLRIANAHDDGSETLGVVLCVTRVQRNRLEVQAAGQVDRSDKILQLGRDARRRSAAGLVRRRSRRC